MNERFRIRRSVLVGSFLLCGLATTVGAKAPTLEHLFPAGGSRGSTVEVVATGQFERWPVRAWTSNPGLSVTPATDKGKLAVKIAADLAPGLYWIRLFDGEGSTAPRRFIVGQIQELNEVEPNDEPAKAQPVDSSGLTINGRLGKTGDVDGFRLTLKQGQTLVASMEANRHLGSPMDAVLQVASSDGFVLAQVDDELGRDPRIVFEAPSDGDYLVRTFAFPFVQESSIRFAGSPNYVYRLTLTTGGIVDHAFPLAVSDTLAGEVEAVGWNIPELARKLLVPPAGNDFATTLSGPSLANPVEVRRVDEPTIVEVEPNDRAHPQTISLPVAMSGRIDRTGDVDTFTFSARKGEELVFRVESRELGLPLDAVLRISDETGATLAEGDDARKTADPELRFKAPSDGTYRASIRDLNNHGGPNYAYLLIAGPPRPDFRLSFKAEPLAIAPGKPLDLVITVDRREGFAEPIEISLLERIDGVIAEPTISRKQGPTSTSVTLRLAACDCLQPGPIQIVGIDRDGRRRLATIPVAGLSASIDSAWLTPTKPAATTPPEAKAKP